MSFVIKTVFDGNIHKFSLAKPSYDELEQALSSIYGKRGFSVRYQDEDGDMVTISSSIELAEALRVSKGHLKLFLARPEAGDFVCVETPQVKIHEPAAESEPKMEKPKEEPQDGKRTAAQAFWEAEEAREAAEKTVRLSTEQKTTETKAPVSEAEDKRTKAQAFWDAEEARDTAEKAARLANEQKAEPKTKEEQSCDWKDCEARCEEIRVAVCQLLTDPAVQSVLPELAKAVVGKIVQEVREGKGEPAERVNRVLEVVTQHNVLKDHQAMTALKPHLANVTPCLSRALASIPTQFAEVLDKLKEGLELNAENLLAMVVNPLEALGGGVSLGKFNLEDLGLSMAVLAPVLGNLGLFSCGPVECGFECRPSGGAPDKEVVHSNVRCDGCNVHPIVGARFQCTVCHNYDLCAKCEASGVHPPEHPLLKHRHSNEVLVHNGITCDGCGQSPITGVRYKCRVCPDFDLCATCESKNMHLADHPLIKFKIPRQRGEGRAMFGHPLHGLMRGMFREMRRDGRCGGRGRCGPSDPEAKKTESVTGERKERGEKPWLRIGAQGEAVKELQQALGIHADGIFGRLTERAVREFQFTQDVPVDGLVGPRTWAKLLNPSTPSPSANPAMQALLGMGFTDVELNTRLLQKCNGDVEQVVAEIVGSSPK